MTTIPPVVRILQRRLDAIGNPVIVDPFARNAKWTVDWSNDLDPRTSAKYHLEADDFLDLVHAAGVRADLVIWDPPYSPTQLKRTYDDIGVHLTKDLTQGYPATKSKVSRIVRGGGVVATFGWNSSDWSRGFRFDELTIINHGGAHNDTIFGLHVRENGILD